MDFSWFDILVTVFIILLGIRGAVNGVIKELFNLLGLIGGIFLASRFAQNIGRIVNENIYTMQNEEAAGLVGFVVILLFFWFFCFIVGLIISKLFILGILVTLNRFFGFIFGGLKTFFIFSIIIFALSNIDFIRKNFDNALEDSFMYKAFLSVGGKILDMELKTVSENITEITENIQENTDLILDNVSEIIEGNINISLTPNEQE
ncbi:MAG: CvpA family protein [Campylobacteraceae bacterium]|jgi:membrane protein required for colicin V production|nr:CvpA family protein [Campylobacteraceae bacterium]